MQVTRVTIYFSSYVSLIIFPQSDAKTDFHKLA